VRDVAHLQRLGVKIAAHKIGNAAFFAPEMRISPDSGTPPLISSLSIPTLALRPVLRRQCLHRQRMDLLAHAIAKRLVDELMTLHAGLSNECFAHNHGLEVMTIADHFQVLTLEIVFDITLYVCGATKAFS
jgi:hypothetical protein